MSRFILHRKYELAVLATEYLLKNENLTFEPVSPYGYIKVNEQIAALQPKFIDITWLFLHNLCNFKQITVHFLVLKRA